MIRKPLALALVVALLAGCASRPASPPAAVAVGAPMVAVHIYRGVKVLPTTTNIDWSNKSFGVSGGTLSFFNAMQGKQDCWLMVTVDAANVPVLQGQGGNVDVTIPQPPPPPPGPMTGPGPSPWPAVFDNNPAGHWSIPKLAITNGDDQVSNNVAGIWAGAVFQASTAANQVTILDGTVVGCAM